MLISAGCCFALFEIAAVMALTVNFILYKVLGSLRLELSDGGGSEQDHNGFSGGSLGIS
jgi:hypothetical protein